MRLVDMDSFDLIKADVPDGMDAKSFVAGVGLVLGEMDRMARTTDLVRVVRCKDCKWGKEVCGNMECFADLNAPTEYHGYEWFCPNGKMKNDYGCNVR